MRKTLLEKIIDEITLDELVRWSKDVTAKMMWWKKYYCFINGETKNINTKTKLQWCKLLKLKEHELEKIMENQHKDIIY